MLRFEEEREWTYKLVELIPELAHNRGFRCGILLLVHRGFLGVTTLDIIELTWRVPKPATLTEHLLHWGSRSLLWLNDRGVVLVIKVIILSN